MTAITTVNLKLAEAAITNDDSTQNAPILHPSQCHAGGIFSCSRNALAAPDGEHFGEDPFGMTCFERPLRHAVGIFPGKETDTPTCSQGCDQGRCLRNDILGCGAS